MAGVAEEVGEVGLMVAAPEVAIPMMVGEKLLPHAPTILMIPLIIWSIIIIIIGIIVLATAKNKTPGTLITVLGFLLGAGAFLVISKTEGRKKD